jgi:hypothetical protein
MKVSNLIVHLKEKFEINGEIVLMVNVDQITDPEHTLEQSGISEGVKIVIAEKMMA